MKRRRFLLTSGTSLLGATALTGSQKSVIGLDFDLSADTADPSTVNSVLVDFSSFELLPQFVDEDAGKATITISLNVENQDTVQYSTEKQLTNGEKVTKDDIGSMIPLVVDGIKTTSSINGEVRIEVDHPSVSDTYKQSFFISGDLVLDGLVGWWPLNERSGSTANDISGNGNNGTVNGPTQGVWGRGGLTSYAFDGADDDIQSSSTLSSIAGDSPKTFSFWSIMRSPPDEGYSHPMNVDGDNDGDGFGFYVDSSNDLYFFGGGSFDYNTGYSVPTNQWVHYTLTYDGSTIRTYTDGGETPTPSSNESLTTEDGILHIGQKPNGGSHWDGLIADVRVYNRVLSLQEIQTLYEWGSGDYTKQSLHDGSDTNAISRWKFNGDVTDIWGSNDGTDDTSLVFSSDAIRGQALSFDGQEDYVKVSDSEELDVSKITVSLWFNSESDATDFSGSVRSIIARDDNGTERAWKIGIEDDGSSGIYRLEMFANNRNIIQTSDHPVNINSWMNVVFTYDGEKTRLYENGDQIASATNSGDLKNVDQPINIGGPAELEDNRYFKGLIDDVRIYNRALSKDEVFQLYQWGTRGKNLKEAIENYQSN